MLWNRILGGYTCVQFYVMGLLGCLKIRVLWLDTPDWEDVLLCVPNHSAKFGLSFQRLGVVFRYILNHLEAGALLDAWVVHRIIHDCVPKYPVHQSELILGFDSLHFWSFAAWKCGRRIYLMSRQIYVIHLACRKQIMLHYIWSLNVCDIIKCEKLNKWHIWWHIRQVMR